jgi:AcrR family transcriptional regulator
VTQRRKRLLTVGAILDAALVCIDETGQLTMTALATRLGTTASSIYHHLDGRAAIVEALRERILSTVELPSLEAGAWDAHIKAWMHSFRHAMAQHPNLIPLMMEQTMTAGPALVGYNRIAGLLQAAGVAPKDVIVWLSVVECYALGSALDLAAPDEAWRVERDDLPTLSNALRLASRGRQRADEAFELGVDALLSGLRHHLEDNR